MKRTLFFYPLRGHDTLRLRPNWCPFDVDEQVAPSGQINGNALARLISQNAAFRDPPSALDLILHNVSSDQYEDLRESMTGHSTIDLVRITAAPRISSYATVSLDSSSCRFIIAIHSPVDAAPISQPSQASPPLPTLQTTPQAELPTSVRLPQVMEGSLTQSDIKLLLPSITIRVRERDIKSITMEDCTNNHVQTPTDSVPSHPEWVTSFIREMSRRRELPTPVCFAGYFHISIILTIFRGFASFCNQPRISGITT